MEKNASKKAKIEVEVDTTQLDEAIKKAKELSELLERINKLKNAILSIGKATDSLVEPVAKDVVNKITKQLEEAATRL